MPVNTLIVDDSNMVSQIIRYHLEEIGCSVVGVARNAAEALRLFRELSPKLITLDLMMPKVEGMDAMMLLRTVKKEAPDTVVIVASIIPFQKTQDDFRQEGVLAYVVKPFNQYSFEPAKIKLMRAFPELAKTGDEV